jgi:hypothetical protein
MDTWPPSDICSHDGMQEFEVDDFNTAIHRVDSKPIANQVSLKIDFTGEVIIHSLEAKRLQYLFFQGDVKRFVWQFATFFVRFHNHVGIVEVREMAQIQWVKIFLVHIKLLLFQ